MEALGAAASIIAVLEVSGKVLSHIRSAKGATKDRKRLRDEVQACDDVLQQLQDDSDESSEDMVLSEKITVLEKPGAPLGRLRITLAMINDKLENSSKSRSRFSDAVASLKWPFNEKEVDKLLVALEREKTLLGLALTIDTQKLLKKIGETSVKNSQFLKELLQSWEDTSKDWKDHFHQLEFGVDTVIRGQEAQEKRNNNRTILDWLSPLDFTSQQNDFIKRRQADTGLWFLRSEEYQHWVTTAKDTLFCPGMPGAGKTILASIVIEELYERYRNQSNIGIAYIFCNFRRQESQKNEDLFSSLLKQLARCTSLIPIAVQDLYERNQRPLSRPDLQEIRATLRSVLRGFKRSFIIIDALDECQDYDNCRSELIQQISSIQTETGLNFFATSRNIPDIMEKFVGAATIEIQASDADIGRYLAAQMPRLSRRILRSDTLQEEIIKNVTKSADGMFLLAQLHMASLVGKTTIRSLRTALKRLGIGLAAYDSAYDDAIARINGQLEDHKELALQVLMWITCAKKPLAIGELQHALAIQIGETSLDEDDFTDVQEMVSVCAGLVTIDQESNIVRLVHYTTQEYFQRQDIQHKWFPAAQETIFKVCTTYLGFEDFAEGAYESNFDYEKRLEKYPFYRYAACNWAHHVDLGPVDWDSIAFLKSKEMIASAFQAVRTPSRAPHNMPDSKLGRSLETLFMSWRPKFFHLTALHLAAYCGFNELVRSSDTSSLNAADVHGETPLHFAVREGHVETVRLLLERGANTEVSNSRGCTPLAYAARPEIARMLLDVGADPNWHEEGMLLNGLTDAIEFTYT